MESSGLGPGTSDIYVYLKTRLTDHLAKVFRECQHISSFRSPDKTQSFTAQEHPKENSTPVDDTPAKHKHIDSLRYIIVQSNDL